MRSFSSLVVRGISLWFVVFAIYVLSYAPFLKLTADPEFPIFRTPIVYRPAEWVILRTPLQPALLKWSEFLGARSEVELQLFFFAQGVWRESDLADWHFNIR